MSNRRSLVLILAGILTALLIAAAFLEAVLRLGLVENITFSQNRSDGVTEGPRHKVFILGDSFVAKRAFGKKLYDELREELTSEPVEFRNAAAAGMGPYDYALEMKTKGRSFKPDLTVLFYYAGNDLTDIQYHALNQGGLKAFGSRAVRFLFWNLYLDHEVRSRLAFLKPRFFDYADMEKKGVDPELIAQAKGWRLNPWILYFSAYHPHYVLDNVLMETPENKKAAETLLRLLDRIHAWNKEQGAQLALVVFPHSTQVNRFLFPYYEKIRMPIDERTLHSTAPQDLVRDYCAARGIPLLDLLPYFRAEKDRELYRQNDDHLNDDGNAYAAGLIAEFLRRLLAEAPR